MLKLSGRLPADQLSSRQSDEEMSPEDFDGQPKNKVDPKKMKEKIIFFIMLKGGEFVEVLLDGVDKLERVVD